MDERQTSPQSSAASSPASGHISSGDLPADAPERATRPLRAWEERVSDAVGNVIEFWGFKRNQGRVWAVLYLRDASLSAPELQRVLGLSKGAVSMITRELEQWGVVRRVRHPGDPAWRFAANSDLLAMVNRVLESREVAFIARVRADLEEAEREAKADGEAGQDVVARVVQMRRLAEVVERSVRMFLRTARLDISGIVGALQARALRKLERGG